LLPAKNKESNSIQSNVEYANRKYPDREDSRGKNPDRKFAGSENSDGEIARCKIISTISACTKHIANLKV
ncbi:MAG: hypothetical protein WC199_05090, partial [Dysgonamonadaceae bacterium]